MSSSVEDSSGAQGARVLEDWVRAEAAERGVSLREIARGARISPQSLYELMDRPTRRGASAARLAHHLGVAPSAVRAMTARTQPERSTPAAASPVAALVAEALGLELGKARPEGALGGVLARRLSCARSTAYQILRGSSPSAPLCRTLIEELGLEPERLAQLLEPELETRWVAARLRRGLSRCELARESGVSVRTVSALERGEALSPTSLSPILRALGIPIEDAARSDEPGATLSARVRTHQLRTGVSLAALAHSCGVSRQGLCQILSGQIKSPRAEILEALELTLSADASLSGG